MFKSRVTLAAAMSIVDVSSLPELQHVTWALVTVPDVCAGRLPAAFLPPSCWLPASFLLY